MVQATYAPDATSAYELNSTHGRQTFVPEANPALETFIRRRFFEAAKVMRLTSNRPMRG